MDEAAWAKRIARLVRKFGLLTSYVDEHGDDYFEHGEYIAWKTQTRIALVALLGADHAYVSHFDEIRGWSLGDGLAARALLAPTVHEMT